MTVSESSANLIRTWELNETHIEQLKKARQRIESGRNTFVCNALGTDESNLRHYIRDLLVGYNSVGMWLQSDPSIHAQINSMPTELYRKEIRKYRLRWIDHMISEIEEVLKQDRESKGDLL